MAEDWDKSFFEFIDKQRRSIHSAVWVVGFNDRGHGHGDFAVLTKKKGILVAKCVSHEVAGHIVELHNASLTKKATKKCQQNIQS